MLTSVIEHVSSWEWNDPVSLIYGKLFGANVVFELKMPPDKIRQEHDRRFLNKIPPGYKDEAKEDQGIGDLLIWLTILQIGESRKKSVIFVSGEEKPDWWHHSEQQTLYPRYELVDEFRRASDGQSFHIIKFSRLLELFGASKNVVAEVQKEEKVTAPSQTGRRVRELAALNFENWLNDSGYGLIPAMNAAYDYVVDGPGGLFAVSIVYTRNGNAGIQKIRTLHRLYNHRLYKNSPNIFDGMTGVVIVVGQTISAAKPAEHEWTRLIPPPGGLAP